MTSCRRQAVVGWAVLAAIVALLAGCVPEPQREVAIGQPLPPFELPDLAGGVLHSDDLAGDGPVLINFWATWCTPCLREIPVLQKLHATGAVRVVSIDVDDRQEIDDEGMRGFVRSHGIEYEVLRGELGTLTRYGSQSIPYTLVLDNELTVRSLHRVVVSASTLERDIGAAR